MSTQNLQNFICGAYNSVIAKRKDACGFIRIYAYYNAGLFNCTGVLDGARDASCNVNFRIYVFSGKTYLAVVWGFPGIDNRT